MAQRKQPRAVPVPPLHVLPRGTAMVPDYEAQDTGTRRFLGWKFDREQGPEFKDATSKKTMRHGGFVRQTGVAVTIQPTNKYRGEYLKHLRDGDLWPADLATAMAAHCAWEPSFGGEHPAVKRDVPPSAPPAMPKRPSKPPSSAAPAAPEK